MHETKFILYEKKMTKIAFVKKNISIKNDNEFINGIEITLIYTNNQKNKKNKQKCENEND